MQDCFKKFDELVRKIGNTAITRPEFNSMMKNAHIKICKLPYEKRKGYVSWKFFELLNKKDTDFWEIDF